MLPYLIALFTIIPAVELLVLIKVGTHIGAANTIAVILLTGILGAYLARLQGFIILQKIQINLNNGIMPTTEMLNGLMVLTGGILLLTPGFITDALGFFLLIPWGRDLIRLFVHKKIQRMMDEGRILSVDPFKRRNDFYDIDPEP